MTEPERAALDHIRRVVDSVIGELASPEIIPIEQAAANILTVPFVSQFGSGGQLIDSGAACGAMLVRAYTEKKLSAADFLNQTGQQGEAPLSFTQISNALRTNGVPVEMRNAFKLADLALILFSGRPVLLMVKQSLMTETGRAGESEDRSMYLVAVGLDVKHIYLHDPSERDNAGRSKAVPWLTFFQAWTQAPGNERSALIPRQQLLRRVKVTAATLNVRQNPNAENSVNGTVSSGEVFEVTEQVEGWGKIGEGRWISLGYVTDI